VRSTVPIAAQMIAKRGISKRDQKDVLRNGLYTHMEAYCCGYCLTGERYRYASQVAGSIPPGVLGKRIAGISDSESGMSTRVPIPRIKLFVSTLGTDGGSRAVIKQMIDQSRGVPGNCFHEYGCRETTTPLGCPAIVDNIKGGKLGGGV